MSKFLEEIKSNAASNLAKFKGRAVEHYSSLSGRPAEECEVLYGAIKAAIRTSVRPVVISSVEAIGSYLSSGVIPYVSDPTLSQSFNALGIGDHFVASVASKDSWDDGLGDCAMELVGDLDGFVVCGGLARLRDPARGDYEPMAKDACLPVNMMLDAKVSSIMLAMGPHDSAGIEAAVNNIMDASREYGRCDLVLLSGPNRGNVACVRTLSDVDAWTIRNILDAGQRLVPVFASKKGNLRVVDPFAMVAEAPAGGELSSEQMYFAVGDPVSMKRSMANMGTGRGSVLDVSNGAVTVEWEDGDRDIYDMAEALMRLQPAPVVGELRPSGVAYETIGLSAEAIEILSSFGVDPVSVYAMASYCRPLAARALGWREKLAESMTDMGLPGRFVNGHVETDDFFEPREWFESRLPHGLRLIVDLSHDNLRIEAGVVDEYVLPAKPVFMAK